jgi:hypothetical protein
VSSVWTAFLLFSSLAHAGDFPTVKFYDARGNKTGSATTYSGGVTKFFDERGRLVGTATGKGDNGVGSKLRYR